MRKAKINLNQYLLYFFLAVFTTTLLSCDDDDDGVIDIEDDATGSIMVNDQTISQNTIIVQSVTVGQDSWLVARNGTDEDSPNIVSETVMLEAGTMEDIELPLMNDAILEGDDDGDQITITLHADDGDGVFNYDDDNFLDNPITDENDIIVSETITVTAPGFDVENQTVNRDDNSVIFSNVNTGTTGGFITLYNQNADGTRSDDIIGRQYVNPGMTDNVTVNFDDDFTYTSGQMIYPQLAIDSPADQQFTYETDPTTDTPETYGFDNTGNAMNVDNEGVGFTIEDSATPTDN